VSVAPVPRARFRARALAFAVEVSERLLRESRPASTRGLNGSAGFALLFAALSEMPELERFLAAMHASLRMGTTACDAAIGLFGGVSGLRASAALAQRIEPRYAKLVAQCDAYVDSQLPPHPTASSSFHDYDLISGWSGIRLARAVRGPIAADRLVDFILWTLEDAERWRCPHPLRPNDAAVNDLGIAHGVAGMLSALALTLDRLEGRAATVADRAMRDLCDRALRAGDLIVWPAAMSSDDCGCRSAWCYGTAGVGAAIYSAARALGDGASADFALDALQRLAARPYAEWAIEGEAVCHGLMGNALCFASVASAAGSERLWNAAYDVAGAALDGLEATGGICWARQFPDGRYDAVELLDGVSGVALAALTLAGDADASWMRLFGLAPLT
jgi:hypothetical protein